ncbi:uncharacterized protein LOC120276222 [Dioscorea cayenensis subsp. rotundata]|uniref:Uncharacterized protein LOC120276222 n=1 Tax=Dioscorea cayennensis subsp. rotundata TaxID=55577 RepID=A0AB40CG11_DIOCR|nr:uncharacterized protein LOC120276222 [Dioscorea cayenensis subsp. rotundata]
MASMEPQKQLLSLIRDFAAEKSQGERRVSDLKKKLLNVVAATDAANAALDEAKRAKEVAERELRGSQVQLSMCDATIQAQLARISLFQGEISKLGSAIDQLKNETGVLRLIQYVVMGSYEFKLEMLDIL